MRLSLPSCGDTGCWLAIRTFYQLLLAGYKVQLPQQCIWRVARLQHAEPLQACGWPEASFLLQDGTNESPGHVAGGSRRQSESARLLQPSAASCEPATSAQTELHNIDEDEQQQPRAPVQPVSSKPGSSGRRLSRGLSRGSSLCSVTELTM